jgi:hypothetical protein
LRRLTNSLINNPSRLPRRPPRKEPPPDIDDLLGESLPLA